MATCPTGWLNANGAAVSRSTYAGLFAAIGTMYGSGDGSTTFNLPDYRGYFLRGSNNGAGIDPDAASRTNRGDGTIGDSVGTKQADDFKGHNHTLNAGSGSYLRSGTGTNANLTLGGGGYSYNPADNTTSTGGNETRPKNINVIYCVSTATIGTVTTASTGSGSANYIPLWTSTTALGNSPVAVSGSNVGIGTTNPSQKLEIGGTALTDGIKFPDGSFQVTANKTLATTYYVNSTRSVFTATASQTLASFTVNKRSATSYLIGNANISCLNSINNASQQGWKLGFAAEVVGQISTFASSTSSFNQASIVVMPGLSTTGSQTMVVRFFTANAQNGLPCQYYNPNSTDDVRLSQTQSVFVVTEVEP